MWTARANLRHIGSVAAFLAPQGITVEWEDGVYTFRKGREYVKHTDFMGYMMPNLFAPRIKGSLLKITGIDFMVGPGIATWRYVTNAGDMGCIADVLVQDWFIGHDDFAGELVEMPELMILPLEIGGTMSYVRP